MELKEDRLITAYDDHRLANMNLIYKGVDISSYVDGIRVRDMTRFNHVTAGIDFCEKTEPKKEDIKVILKEIQETFKLKENCKYIIQLSETVTEQDAREVREIMSKELNIECIIITDNVKVYEVEK